MAIAQTDVGFEQFAHTRNPALYFKLTTNVAPTFPPLPIMATQPQVHVTLLRASMVSPAVPTHCHHLFLPSLDIHWRTIQHSQGVLFYEACNPEDFPSMVATLKESLSLVLVHFFPWAGRLTKGGDGGRFVLDCNDAGVEFVEASIDLPFSALVKTGFQFEPFYQNLVQWGQLRRTDQPDLPLLSVQVTKFEGGGMALATSQSHVVADGGSMWQFMVSWGECARGVPMGKTPLHDRTALRLDNPSVEVAKRSMLAWFIGEEPPAKPSATAAETPAAKTIERVFHVTSEMARRLKAEAGHGRTSFEALAAHFWRSVARAAKAHANSLTHIGITVDCRKRLHPPLPDNYFGNVVCFVTTVCRIGDLAEETLGATAARIHEAIVSQSTDETVRAYMHWLELHDNILPPPQLESIGVTVSGSPRFPAYQVDFGWGPPTSVRPIRVGMEWELCLFPGVEGGGSVDVFVRLKEEIMISLERDPLFLPSYDMDN